MKNIYRPVEFWKSALLTISDNSFFELARSVFGKIKTPFNKVQLVNDLEAFLLREDIQKTIAGYIDAHDAKIIAAISLFGECAPGELESFFSGELSYARLQDIIVNLEERFILYRFSVKDTVQSGNLIALNPVLKQALEPYISGISALLPVVKAEEQNINASRKMIIDDLFLASLLSFVLQEDNFFRGEGVIRKKTKDRGHVLFPGFDLDKIFGSMQLLGLFYTDQDKLIPDMKHFEDFGILNTLERMEYCAAAFLTYNKEEIKENILAPLYRAKIRETVNFIHGFLDSLDVNLLYPVKTLKKIAQIHIRNMRSSININIDNVIDVMEMTDLLASVSPDLTRLGSAFRKNNETKNTEPCIGIDSNSSILVYPQISYLDAVSLALILRVKETGPVVRFELDRDCAVRAFDRGVKSDEIIALLARLAGGKPDETFAWTLHDWEKRYNEVSLKKGVILNLCKDKRYLTETRALSALILETIAPGVYLLGEDSIEDAASALHSAGIEIIARGKKSKNNDHYHYFQNPASSEDKKIKINNVITSKTDNNAAAQINHFYTILDSMNLNTAEKTQLSARIERRLILCEDQLKEADIRYEKLEARFMDYAGKQNIAKQAITQKTPLELVCVTGKNEERIFGIPKTLKKKDNDMILEIAPTDSGELLNIPLGKISLLRRIKKSIFEV